MKDLEAGYIYAKPSQYKSVMKVLFDLEIFPMEEDPTDLQDYIDNFNFSERSGKLIRFPLWCSGSGNMDFLENKLRDLPDYDSIKKLPRVEMERSEV